MFLIDDYIFKIRVDKEPGLYGFEPMSATGKTYLCKICKRLNGYGKKVAGYDLYDYRKEVKLPTGMDLIVVDRYDLYPVLDDELYDLAQTAIVLVDGKTAPFGDVCQVECLGPGNIWVY